jgi:hypothetical protein
MDEPFTMLCSDSQCSYRTGNGYYGVCSLYKQAFGDTPPTVGMVRQYVSSCTAKKVEDDKNDK